MDACVGPRACAWFREASRRRGVAGYSGGVCPGRVRIIVLRCGGRVTIEDNRSTLYRGIVEEIFDRRIELFERCGVVRQIFDDRVPTIPPAEEVHFATTVAAERSGFCFRGVDRFGADRAGHGLDHGQSLSLLFLLAGIVFFFELVEVFQRFVIERITRVVGVFIAVRVLF